MNIILTILAVVTSLIIVGYLYRGAKFRKYRFRIKPTGTDGTYLYEEACEHGTRSVNLPSHWTEPGRSELFIPTQDEWLRIAPDWAASRRDEIFKRVISQWKAFDIHYPNDWD